MSAKTAIENKSGTENQQIIPHFIKFSQYLLQISYFFFTAYDSTFSSILELKSIWKNIPGKIWKYYHLRSSKSRRIAYDRY